MVQRKRNSRDGMRGRTSAASLRSHWGIVAIDKQLTDVKSRSALAATLGVFCEQKIFLMANYGSAAAEYCAAVSEFEQTMIRDSKEMYAQRRRKLEVARVICETALRKRAITCQPTAGSRFIRPAFVGTNRRHAWTRVALNGTAHDREKLLTKLAQRNRNWHSVIIVLSRLTSAIDKKHESDNVGLSSHVVG